MIMRSTLTGENGSIDIDPNISWEEPVETTITGRAEPEKARWNAIISAMETVHQPKENLGRLPRRQRAA